MDRAVSRRAFLAGVAGAVAVSRLTSAQEVPTITKRVEKLYKVAGSKEPNDLQFVPEGLWVLDQVDQPTNKAFLVKPEDEVMLISSSGTLVRTPVSDISIQGRNTQGVRLIRLDEGDRLVGMERIVSEGGEAGESGDGSPDDGEPAT